jgi:hypothetical protein
VLRADSVGNLIDCDNDDDHTNTEDSTTTLEVHRTQSPPPAVLRRLHNKLAPTFSLRPPPLPPRIGINRFDINFGISYDINCDINFIIAEIGQ